MTNLNERNCNYCDIPYSLDYKDKRGYTYQLSTEYCSKSCASKAKENKGCIRPDVGKEALKDKVTAYIQSRGEYCTKDEICKGVGHSSKTFTKHGIRFSDMNRALGFDKPKSKFQDSVGNVLKEQFNIVETEVSFEGLVGNTGHPLRVDFYIPEINTVVEADGSQHSDPNHPWREWNNGSVAEYDGIKNQFFEERGTKLVRIPYKRGIKESDILSRLS